LMPSRGGRSRIDSSTRETPGELTKGLGKKVIQRCELGNDSQTTLTEPLHLLDVRYQFFLLLEQFCRELIKPFTRGVSCSLRFPTLSKRRHDNSRSSPLICWLRADWVLRVASAAFVRLPNLATW